MALLLSLLFSFAACGGEDKPFEQLCDEYTGLKPQLSGLQDSWEHDTRHMLIHNYESFQSIQDELKTKNVVELPDVKEKMFKDNVYLLIVHSVSIFKYHEYQVKEVSVDQQTLSVQAALAEDPDQSGGAAERYQVVLVRLDKELVKDVQKVSVKTEHVDKSFFNYAW